MEEAPVQPPINQFNYSSQEVPKKPKKFFYLIIFLVILAGFFLTKNLFFGSGKQEKVPAVTPTPTEYQFPTDTPASSANPTSEPTKPAATPTAKAVNPVDSATGLDRSTLSIEVQNGSGETGAASKGSEILKSFGYKISSTANADNFDYQNVTIQVKNTKTNFLALLKKDLGFSYTVGSTSADLSPDSSSDALVIIGK